MKYGAIVIAFGDASVGLSGQVFRIEGNLLEPDFNGQERIDVREILVDAFELITESHVEVVFDDEKTEDPRALKLREYPTLN